MPLPAEEGNVKSAICVCVCVCVLVCVCACVCVCVCVCVHCDITQLKLVHELLV